MCVRSSQFTPSIISFSTGVPFIVQTVLIPSSLSPKGDCGLCGRHPALPVYAPILQSCGAAGTNDVVTKLRHKLDMVGGVVKAEQTQTIERCVILLHSTGTTDTF